MIRLIPTIRLFLMILKNQMYQSCQMFLVFPMNHLILTTHLFLMILKNQNSQMFH